MGEPQGRFISTTKRFRHIRPIDHAHSVHQQRTERWASRRHLCSIAKTERRSDEPARWRPTGWWVMAVDPDDPLLRVDGIRVSFGGLDVLTDVTIDMPPSGRCVAAGRMVSLISASPARSRALACSAD